MQTIEELKAYLRRQFPEAKIWLFGSRARETATPHSDIDIAIETTDEVAKKLTLVRFEIEESNIPYKVDLVDLKQASYLREIVKKEGVRWY